MKPRRIAIVGPVAAGKTTLAAAVATQTGLPSLDLDDLYWGPAWTPVGARAFHRGVRDALAAETWIAHGNYGGQVADMLINGSELVVWLDFPLRTCLPRLIRRSIRRAVTGQELFAGNRETFRNLLSRDSIVWWGLVHHRRHRLRWADRLGPGQAARRYVLRIERPAALGPSLRALGLLPSAQGRSS